MTPRTGPGEAPVLRFLFDRAPAANFSVSLLKRFPGLMDALETFHFPAQGTFCKIR